MDGNVPVPRLFEFLSSRAKNPFPLILVGFLLFCQEEMVQSTEIWGHSTARRFNHPFYSGPFHFIEAREGKILKLADFDQKNGRKRTFP